MSDGGQGRGDRYRPLLEGDNVDSGFFRYRQMHC
jgi:hypothetical protein